MFDNNPSIRRTQRNRLIKSLAINLAIAGLTVYLFIPAGPVYSAWRIDLNFLLLPIIGFCIIRLASAFCLILIPTRKGYILVNCLRATAAAFLLYLLFDKAILFTRISILNGLQTFLAGLAVIKIFAVLFVIGITLVNIFALFRTAAYERDYGHLGAAVGQVIIGISLWQAVDYYSQYWEPCGSIGLILLVAMCAMVLSTLGFLGYKSGYTLISDFCIWLKTSPAEKFLIGAALAVYLLILRPFMYRHMSYAFILEWIIICLIAGLIYKGVKNVLNSRHTTKPVEQDWQKHVQQIDDLYSDDFNKIGMLQRDFVEQGTRRELLNYLRKILSENKYHEDQINDALHNLLEYSDKKIHWYCILFWRKRIININLYNRRKALENTINNLTELTSPVYRNNRSSI